MNAEQIEFTLEKLYICLGIFKAICPSPIFSNADPLDPMCAAASLIKKID